MMHLNATEHAIAVLLDPEASKDAKELARQVLMERERLFSSPTWGMSSPMLYGPCGTEIQLPLVWDSKR